MTSITKNGSPAADVHKDMRIRDMRIPVFHSSFVVCGTLSEKRNLVQNTLDAFVFFLDSLREFICFVVLKLKLGVTRVEIREYGAPSAGKLLHEAVRVFRKRLQSPTLYSLLYYFYLCGKLHTLLFWNTKNNFLSLNQHRLYGR